MTHRPIYEGQRVTVECTFRLAGVPTDPIVVQCTYKHPVTGSQTTLNYPDDDLIRRSLGVFEANIHVDAGGMWWFRFEGAGVVDAVTEIPLEVISSVMS
jgi:hypothetical protein